MEKITSTFWFVNEYQDQDEQIQKTIVVLELEYKNERYSIKPFCGIIKEGFRFEQCSHKWQMWKAILKGIDQAIDFANDELRIADINNQFNEHT
jgi:hypothetical protein